jgi:hypothetical protein
MALSRVCSVELRVWPNVNFIVINAIKLMVGFVMNFYIDLVWFLAFNYVYCLYLFAF